MIPFLRFRDISVSLTCKLHIWRSIWGMTYWRMLYIFAIIKLKSLRSNHVRVFLQTTPNMSILKWFRFIIAKIYNILRHVIDHKLRHMRNLHIKEIEISQKRSKGIKNWKITYSVILSVLSNKTNSILGFSSPLKDDYVFRSLRNENGDCG